MKITFSYELEREYDNFLRGYQSINHGGQQSAFTQKILGLGIRKDDRPGVINYCSIFIKENNINTSEKVEQIEGSWRLIESKAFETFRKLFGRDLPFSETGVYLSLNDRSAYNYQQHYFFVAMNQVDDVNRIVLHELMHFYTYQFILPMFIKNKIPKDSFNDFKEALTVLLNTEFAGLLGGNIDKGYEKQKKLRNDIVRLWLGCGDVYILTEKLMKANNSNGWR